MLYLLRCQLHGYLRDGSYVRETAEDVTDGEGVSAFAFVSGIGRGSPCHR
jgi:hypothetical protein